MEIYLVEDCEPVRARLADMLAAIPGARLVGEAARATDAIRDILALRPDVVLLDVSLAEGSGFDVLRAVCRQAPEIDFYMLSNFAADPYRQLAERLGARGFFDKSNEFERLRNILVNRGETEPCLP
jgi:DNA-binding NarL/FixJ family response regulator